MKLTSDQQHLMYLKRNRPVEDFDIYKAAIAVANVGSFYSDEIQLSQEEVTLLNARRFIFQENFTAAEASLLTLETTHPLLEADRQFLLAQVNHRRGYQQAAYHLMIKAADLYQEAGDPYRELRARTNGAICVSSLESCLMGELLAYEQEARRQGFNEIAGNICRTRSMELLISGNPIGAYTEAMEAAQLYQLDGYPDDRAVAIVMAAIALQMNDETKRALETVKLCLIKEGKVKQYLDIFESLSQGKVPKLHSGHPLSRVKWKKVALKSESVPGKIVNTLKIKPCSKDELIQIVWGENALDASYVARLHTAINYLRKSKGVFVEFDGEKYKLI